MCRLLQDGTGQFFQSGFLAQDASEEGEESAADNTAADAAGAAAEPAEAAQAEAAGSSKLENTLLQS